MWPLWHVNRQGQCLTLKRRRRNCPSENMLHIFLYIFLYIPSSSSSCFVRIRRFLPLQGLFLIFLIIYYKIFCRWISRFSSIFKVSQYLRLQNNDFALAGHGIYCILLHSCIKSKVDRKNTFLFLDP